MPLEDSYRGASKVARAEVDAGQMASGAANEVRFRESADYSTRKSELERQAAATMQKAKLSAPPPAAVHKLALAAESDFNTEAYAYQQDNAYQRVADHPLSTFSIDVDTASYSNVRRFLSQKQRPPADAVRIEELVNYFPYDYAPPTGNVPFAASLEVADAPWAPEHRLVRIGLKGREVSDAQRPAANLVFLLDVSGSMNAAEQAAAAEAVAAAPGRNKLRPDDRVAIAVYAGLVGPGAALDPRGAADRDHRRAREPARRTARPTAPWASSSPTTSRRPTSSPAA